MTGDNSLSRVFESHAYELLVSLQFISEQICNDIFMLSINVLFLKHGIL
jgi:hypothetical protein